jgi:hypothetical protein
MALAEVKEKSEAMSIFTVELHPAIDKGLTVRSIPNLVKHETNELFFDNLEIPEENLFGEEGEGFKYILDGLNAERTPIAAERIGNGSGSSTAPPNTQRPDRARPADGQDPGRARHGLSLCLEQPFEGRPHARRQASRGTQKMLVQLPKDAKVPVQSLCARRRGSAALVA